MRQSIALALGMAVSAPWALAQDADPGFWRDARRGWHFYEDPRSEPGPSAPVTSSPPAAPSQPVLATRAPELAAFDRLQKAVEETRHIAIMAPTEANVRRYMALEAQVVGQASTFADVAQRVAWSTPELDPALQGRPVNARAIEVYEEQQGAQRSRSLGELGHDHVLIFFFRSDCPYCHALAPTLAAFQARHGVQVEAISLDGGELPGFAGARRDNGIATALQVTQVPAVYLAQPFTGRITPVGFGVLSEAQIVERLAAITSPGYDAMVPGATRQIVHP